MNPSQDPLTPDTPLNQPDTQPELQSDQSSPAVPIAPVTPTPPSGPQVVYPPSPAPKSNKKMLLIAGVVVAVLAIGGIAFALTNKKDSTDKTAKPKTKVSSSLSKKAGATNTKVATAVTPAGYVPLEKLCYTIQIPKDNDAGAENDCEFSARFGAEKLTSITVAGFTKYHEDLDTNVASLKDTEAKSGSAVVSEDSIMIGGLDGKKIVFKGSGAYGLTTAHFLVGTDKYKLGGVPVTGFEVIAASYDKTDNKTIIDNIIASWQWK